MQVAREFGRPDVDRFEREVSAHQIMEWVAFGSLEKQEREQAGALEKSLAATSNQSVQALLKRNNPRR